jgi:hypothetical protein
MVSCSSYDLNAFAYQNENSLTIDFLKQCTADTLVKSVNYKKN